MEKTFETPRGADLYVENEVGLVVVTARATDTTVVSLKAETSGGAELIERATVELRPSGGRHVVAVQLPRQHGRRILRRDPVTVNVEVPEGGRVGVMTASADIEINGLVGEVDVKTASGDATADDVAADVNAMTARGNITVRRVGGDIKAQTASGDLRCSSVAGTTVFSTVSGDLELGAAGRSRGGQGDLGQCAAGRARPRGQGGERVGQRARPHPQRR